MNYTHATAAAAVLYLSVFQIRHHVAKRLHFSTSGPTQIDCYNACV